MDEYKRKKKCWKKIFFAEIFWKIFLAHTGIARSNTPGTFTAIPVLCAHAPICDERCLYCHKKTFSILSLSPPPLSLSLSLSCLLKWFWNKWPCWKEESHQFSHKDWTHQTPHRNNSISNSCFYSSADNSTFGFTYQTKLWPWPLVKVNKININMKYSWKSITDRSLKAATFMVS